MQKLKAEPSVEIWRLLAEETVSRILLIQLAKRKRKKNSMNLMENEERETYHDIEVLNQMRIDCVKASQ